MPRKLGSVQESVLNSLREYGSWHRGGFWYWDTNSGTERIMESLVKRGVATKRQDKHRTIYEPVKEKKVVRCVKGKK